MRTINLPLHGITIQLNEDGTGAIDSDLHDARDEMPEPPEVELPYDAAMDGIESLILAHARMGIDVEAPAYLEGIATAVDAMANHYGE